MDGLHLSRQGTKQLANDFLRRLINPASRQHQHSTSTPKWTDTLAQLPADDDETDNSAYTSTSAATSASTTASTTTTKQLDISDLEDFPLLPDPETSLPFTVNYSQPCTEWTKPRLQPKHTKKTTPDKPKSTIPTSILVGGGPADCPIPHPKP